MNLMVKVLSEKELDPLSNSNTTLVVEDCVGESIHIHLRNFRFEMNVDDFKKFASNLEEGENNLEQWESS